MCLLVVKDELSPAEYLRQGLSEYGCAAGAVLTGNDDLHLALTLVMQDFRPVPAKENQLRGIPA